MIFLASFLACALAPIQDVKFSFSGPMNALLAEGKKPGTATTGIPVAVVLTDGGAKIQTTDFELKVPGTDKTLKLSLGDAKFAAGHLTATAKITDGLDTSIEGVRLDVTGATESYRAKDKDGKDIILVRPESVSIASPLFYGDLGPGEDNAFPLDASQIEFKPQTTQVAVNLSISGLRYVTTLHFGDNCSGRGQIDVNSKSQVFMSNTAGNSVMRMDADGSHVTPLVKLPDQAKGMAVNPKTGDIAANCGNHPKLFIFTASGDDKASLEGDTLIPGWPSLERYDSKGTLWSTCGGTLVSYTADNTVAEKIEKFGDFDFQESAPFDVAPDGSVVAVIEKSVFRLNPDHKTARKIAQDGADRLGQLLDPQGCRFDAQGNVYVAEFGDNSPANPARMSVFDKNGNLVRVFGRGAKAPKPGYPDAYWDSQANQPYDIAFGPDGKVYISQNGEQAPILVFQPF